MSPLFQILAKIRCLTLVSIVVLALSQIAFAAPAGKPPGENPYQVERSWPDYFLEHQKLFTEQAGTYKAGDHPVWTVHVPGGWIGNATIIEGDDGLIVYDTSVNIEAGATRLSLGINFTDSGDSYTVELRNSILEITAATAPAGMSAVSLSTDQLRSVLAGEDVQFDGDRSVLNQLIAYLDREQQGFSMHVR